MKKIFLMLVLAGISTGAFASKARLEAFGESKYGSFVFDDYRNIYLNMAAINDYKNYATVELGTSTINTTTGLTSSSADSATNPKAEAGITFGAGSMVYGIHYGYYSDALSNFRQAILGVFDLTAAPTATSATHDISAQNVIDLMVGSETSSMKWGFALQYSASKNESVATQKVEQHAYAARAGVEMGKLKLGTIVALGNSVKMDDLTVKELSTGAATTGRTGTTAEFKGKLGLEVNGSYDLSGNMKVFGKYQTQKAEGINARLTELKYTKMEVGTSKMYNFSKTNFMFVKFDITNEKTTATTAAGSSETKETYAPLSIGVEGQAKEWLRLRASAVMNLYSSTETAPAGKITGTGTTSLNTGATLVFGDLSIDGFVGTTTAGNLQLDNLMTRVSMTYNF